MKKNLIFYIFVASAIAGYLLIFINLHPYFRIGSDFVSFFTGAKIMQDGKGEMLYDIATQFSYQKEIIKPYTNSILNRYATLPFVALFYLPLTAFSYLSAHRLFSFINLGVLFLLLSTLLREFKQTKKYRPILALSVFLFVPTFTTLLSSQLSFIIAFLVLFIYFALRDKKSLLAGILSGLLIIKVQYLIMLPFLYFLSKNKSRYLSGVFLSLVLITLVNVSLVGAQPLLGYPSFVLNTEVPSFGNRAYQMFSLHAAASYLFFDSNLNNYFGLLINTGGYLAALALFLKRLKKIEFSSAYIAAVVLSATFAAHVLSHDLMLLIVPIFILLNRELEKKTIDKEKIFLAALLFATPALVVTKAAFLGGFLLLAISIYVMVPRAFAGRKLLLKLKAIYLKKS